MKKVLPLSEAKIRTAKPDQKPTYLYDGEGLYMEIKSTGSKGWRFNYVFGGKRRLVSFGNYPEVSLADARKKREDARRLVAGGVDPAEHKKAVIAAGVEKNANSFEVIAQEWLSLGEPDFAPSHFVHLNKYFKKDINPWLGSRPIADIAPPDLLAIARRIEGRRFRRENHVSYFRNRAFSSVGNMVIRQNL